jgi:hypothetical protein
METDLGVLKHPFPVLLAVDAGAGLSAAHQAAAAHAGEDCGDARVQTPCDPLEHVGQAALTEVQATHRDKSADRRSSLSACV